MNPTFKKVLVYSGVGVLLLLYGAVAFIGGAVTDNRGVNAAYAQLNVFDFAALKYGPPSDIVGGPDKPLWCAKWTHASPQYNIKEDLTMCSKVSILNNGTENTNPN